MKLDISGRKSIESPSVEDIRDALGEMDDDFLILETRPWTYMQCAGDVKVGFALEYQEGSLEKHFEVEGAKLDAEAVLMALSSYLNGDGAWREAHVWVKMEF